MVGMDQPQDAGVSQKRKKVNESFEQDQARKKRKCLQKYKDMYTIELNRQRSTTKVEVMMCELIAELNLPLSSADTFNKAFKLMFPDSKIGGGQFLFYFLCVGRRCE